MIDKEKLRARILAEPDVDCEIGAPMSERDEFERLVNAYGHALASPAGMLPHMAGSLAARNALMSAIDALQERVARAREAMMSQEAVDAARQAWHQNASWQTLLVKAYNAALDASRSAKEGGDT